MITTSHGLFATLLAIAATVLIVSSASATDYYGNNAFTRYRLPWQHGDWHYMTQGYQEGNHGNWSGQYYSLDFAMNNETPVLAITEGAACYIDDIDEDSTGLGIYVVQTAPAHTGTGTDYYFYGHNSGTWIEACGSGSTYLYQGEITSWSGNTGDANGYHLHMTVQKPGNTCYCGSTVSVTFPQLSGVEFSGKSGNQTNKYYSDSVMPGDNNTKPNPTWNEKIFDAWLYNGGMEGIGVPWNAAGGVGVHTWGNGIVQDFAPPLGGTAIIMLQNGADNAHGVYGAIFLRYLDEDGADGWLGYPISGEYNDPLNSSYRRSDFEEGFICWSGTTWIIDWDLRWWC